MLAETTGAKAAGIPTSYIMASTQQLSKVSYVITSVSSSYPTIKAEVHLTLHKFKIRQRDREKQKAPSAEVLISATIWTTVWLRNSKSLQTLHMKL